MEVKRIHTKSGSHVEPPLEQWWSDLKKLTWKAAVAEVDCGLRITVEPSEYSIKRGPIWVKHGGFYDVIVPGSSSGPHTFDSAWSYINGIETGVNAARTSSSASGAQDA